MPGNFTAKALIVLNFGTNALQYYGRFQHHCVPVLSLMLVPVNVHLHGITLGMKDSLKGGLTFRKRNPQRLLVGIADRKAEPI